MIFCHSNELGHKKLMQWRLALKHRMQRGIYTRNYEGFKSHSLTTIGSVEKLFIWTLHEVGRFGPKYTDISIKPSIKSTLQCNSLEKLSPHSGLSWEKPASISHDIERYILRAPETFKPSLYKRETKCIQTELQRWQYFAKLTDTELPEGLLKDVSFCKC